jgi:hypothetical protein
MKWILALMLALAGTLTHAQTADWTYPPLRSPESVIRDDYNAELAHIQSLFVGVASDLAGKIDASLAGATGMALLGATTAGAARSTLGLGSAALQASSAFAAAVHGHAAADISDFATAADARVTAGLASHTAAPDPHPGYLTPAEGNAAYATAAQGALAASAVQPGSLATVATTGSYLNLSDVPLTFAPAAHTQAASTITDFAEAVDDRTAALLVAGSGVTLTYDDGAGTLTVAASGGGETFLQNRWVFSEFMSGANNAEQPYLWSVLSSGTSVGLPTTFDPLHPGSIIIRDSTTANGGGSWAVAQGLRGAAGLAGRIIFSPRTTFADVTTRAGFHDSTTTAVTDGAYWDIETGTGLARAICRNNSVETVSPTTFQTVLGTFYTFDIDYLTDSTVQFTLSSDAGARLMQTTVSTNCPNTDARAFSFRFLTREGTTNAAADLIWLDYMGFGPARPTYAPVP